MRKRSSYKPRPVNPSAHIVAMLGAGRLSVTDTIKRAQNLHDAIERASRAEASQDDWRLIFDAINIIEQLCRMRVLEGLDVLEGLQETVVSIMDRAKKTGTKALRASELAALREFRADYATVLRGVTQQQYFRAQAAVEDRIRRVLSGERIPASVRVVEAVE